MWTSAAGAAAQSQSIDTLANNLANMDTPAFKKDTPTFKEYLATIEREHPNVDIPRGPIKDKDFYPLDGRDQSFVVTDGTYTNFRQGGLRVTQSPLDVALDGPGFLEVSTPAGVRYTRQGSLKLSKDGQLVTSEGYPVLASQPGGLAARQPAANAQPGQGGLMAQGGAAVEARSISLKDRGTHITINDRGEIYAGDQLVAQLGVVEFPDVRKLRKEAGQLFVNSDSRMPGAQAAETVVRQGMLETSNVNPVEEMTKLITANRLFEQGLKAMKTYDNMMGREVNDIGKL